MRKTPIAERGRSGAVLAVLDSARQLSPCHALFAAHWQLGESPFWSGQVHRVIVIFVDFSDRRGESPVALNLTKDQLVRTATNGGKNNLQDFYPRDVPRSVVDRSRLH